MGDACNMSGDGDADLDSFFDDGDAAPMAEAAAPAEPAPAQEDMSGAFVTSSNLSDSGPLQEWRAANKAKLEERAAESKKQLAAILAQAKTDRDQFYAQRQQTIDSTKK